MYLVLESTKFPNLFWNRDTNSFETIKDATHYTEKSLKHCIEHHKDELPKQHTKVVRILTL